MPTSVPRSNLRAQLDTAHAPLVVDVRSPSEFAAGHLPGAINIPADQVETDPSVVPAGRPVVCVCTRGGHRSQGAAARLDGAGRSAVYLEGGWLGWQEPG